MVIVTCNNTEPNRTLASVDGLKQDGLTVTKWGYFSDIVTGPFLAFGSDSEDKDMLKKKNDMAVHTTQEICMHNLSSLLYEYQHHGTYRPNDPSWVPATSLMSSSSSSTDPHRPQHTDAESSDTTDFFKIHFLPCDPHITFNTRKDRYNGKFDMVFIGSGFGHRVQDVNRLLKDKSGEDEESTVIVETAKFLLDLTMEQKTAFLQKLYDLARDGGLSLCPKQVKRMKKLDGKLDTDWEFILFERKMNGLVTQEKEDERVGKLRVIEGSNIDSLN